MISLEISFIIFPVISTQFFMIKMKCWAWRYYSEIKITGCASIGTVFISQHPHDGSQPLIIPNPGNLEPSSVLHRAPGFHITQRLTCRQNT